MVPLTGEVFSLPMLEFFDEEIEQFYWNEKPKPMIPLRTHLRTGSVRDYVHIGAKYYRGGDGIRPLPFIVDLYLLPVPFIIDLYFDPIVNMASEVLYR